MTGIYIFSVFLHEARLYGQRPDGAVYEEDSVSSIDEFCSRNKGDEGWTKAAFGLTFSPAFTENEMSKAVQLMNRNGFTHVRAFHFNQYLVGMVKAHRQALIMSADGDDLYMSLYDTALQKLLALKKAKGIGRDPRVKVLAEKLWTQISDEAAYLNHDNALPVLAKVAAKFLSSGKAEEDGSVFLEGENRDYFITKSDSAIDNSIDYGGSSVLTSLGTFTNENSVHKGDCVLVLSDGLGGNPYFEKLLNGSFPDTMIVSEEVTRGIFKDMMTQLGGEAGVSDSNIIVDDLPSNSIHVKASEDSIHFNIDFPKGVKTIQVERDGKNIRTLTVSEFTDEGLQPAHKYSYKFIIVTTGDDGVVAKSKGITREYSTTDIKLPDPAVLTIADEVRSALLTWTLPDGGETRIYVSSAHPTNPVDGCVPC